MLSSEIVPALLEVVRHDAGHLADLERDARDLFDFLLLCGLLQSLRKVQDDAHLVHISPS